MELHALYESEELPRAQAAEKRVRKAMLMVAAVGLLLCVLFCCFTTRKNQDVTLPLTVGASILSGWIVIFLSHSRFDGARAKARHAQLMLTGPRETFSGRFEKLEGVYRVKKGVSIRKVRLQDDFHETLLTISAEKAALVPDAFTGTVETVYDCIVAWAEDGAKEVSA
jgi:hypothetical protein